MKEQNPNLKLLSISIICAALTGVIWELTQNDPSSSIIYLIWFVVLYVICAIVANIIIAVEKAKVKSWNLLALIFCTPIPYLILYKLAN